MLGLGTLLKLSHICASETPSLLFPDLKQKQQKRVQVNTADSPANITLAERKWTNVLALFVSRTVLRCRLEMKSFLPIQL